METPTRLTNNTTIDLAVERTESGGLGVVYMGPNHLDGDRWFTLKTYQQSPSLAARRNIHDRFVREAITSAGIWPHPNLLPGITVLQINLQPYILMEYAEGGNLRSHFQHGHTISTRLRWAQMIASGLLALHTPDPDFLHPHPLVHRDLKPENILLNARKVARISDFGLTRAFEDNPTDDAETDSAADDTGTRSRLIQTERGIAIGTPAYMAPEQWIDTHLVGTYTDIYAFGVILSELFAGRHALLGPANRRAQPWLVLHARQTPHSLREVTPNLPTEVETLYYGCLEKRPENRPTASEALTALQRAAEAMGERPYVAALLERTSQREGHMWNRWAIAFKTFCFHEEALARNQRALDLLPDDLDILLTHVDLLNCLNHDDEALAYIEKGFAVVQNERDRRQLWKLRAILQQKREEYAASAASFAQAQTPEDANIWCSRATLHIRWARTEWDNGHVDAAQQYLQLAETYARHAVVHNPNHPFYISLYAVLHDELLVWGTTEPWQRCRCQRDERGELTIKFEQPKHLRSIVATAIQEHSTLPIGQ